MPADSLMNFFLVTQAFGTRVLTGIVLPVSAAAAAVAANASARERSILSGRFVRSASSNITAPAPRVYSALERPSRIYLSLLASKCSLWQGTISHELGRDMMIIRVRITISFARNASQRVAWLLFGAQAELKKKKKAPPAS